MNKYNRITKKGTYYDKDDFELDLIIELDERHYETVQDIDAVCEKLNRLVELEDKLENGTLVELPCKVGTKVYFTIDYPAYFEPIEETIVNGVSQFNIDGTIENQITTTSCLCFSWERDFGKTLFLTKAEAETKLKEIKDV